MPVGTVYKHIYTSVSIQNSISFMLEFVHFLKLIHKVYHFVHILFNLFHGFSEPVFLIIVACMSEKEI